MLSDNVRQVNFGLWYDFRNPPPHRVSFEDLYRASLEQIAWAETLGFDSVWLTEHHFCEDGYTPSPLVIAAAIGARTSRLRIGTNLMLLPLADPVRLAEDAATVSILTDGRFDLGVGLGYRQLEFDYFGRKLSHRPSLMEEGVAIIRQAWSGEPVRVSGKRFRIDGLRVTPVPKVAPRLFMGGLAPVSIERAARLGDGFLSTGGIGHDVYVKALQDQGKARGQGAICAGHWGIIAADPDAEAAKVGAHVLYQINQYVAWGAFGPPDQVPQFPDAATALRDGLYELCDADAAVASLTRMLRDYPEIIDVHFWAQFPGEPVASGSARMEYIARQVLPRVRANLAEQPPRKGP
jgi:alkanesulfonate monooxygenase SsuD/methylene tetrahydromethanopterin reductase-like flavin-dependent oxidoreductase (luciferase family)